MVKHTPSPASYDFHWGFAHKTIIKILNPLTVDLTIFDCSFDLSSEILLSTRATSLFLHIYDARKHSFIDWNHSLLRFHACRSLTASDVLIERLKYEIKLSPQEISISRRRTEIWSLDWRVLVLVLGSLGSFPRDLQLSFSLHVLILTRWEDLRGFVFTLIGEKEKLWGRRRLCLYIGSFVKYLAHLDIFPRYFPEIFSPKISSRDIFSQNIFPRYFPEIFSWDIFSQNIFPRYFLPKYLLLLYLSNCNC